jgi:hypothetical protein
MRYPRIITLSSLLNGVSFELEGCSQDILEIRRKGKDEMKSGLGHGAAAFGPI